MIYVIIFTLILVAILYKKEKFTLNIENNIWMYWENKKGATKFPYLNLCFDTVKKHCNKSFNIHLLNETSQ